MVYFLCRTRTAVHSFPVHVVRLRFSTYGKQFSCLGGMGSACYLLASQGAGALAGENVEYVGN